MRGHSLFCLRSANVNWPLSYDWALWTFCFSCGNSHSPREAFLNRHSLNIPLHCWGQSENQGRWPWGWERTRHLKEMDVPSQTFLVVTTPILLILNDAAFSSTQQPHDVCRSLLTQGFINPRLSHRQDLLFTFKVLAGSCKERQTINHPALPFHLLLFCTRRLGNCGDFYQ